MKLDFVFICQSGELEIKASLLAASIRRFCSSHSTLHIIEPSPPEVYGTVSAETKNFLTSMGAHWYTFTNPISDDYKIGNKLNAFKITAQGDRIVFLDSDTIFYNPLPETDKYFRKDFAAKGSDEQTFDSIVQKGLNWNIVYDLFALPFPQMMWPAPVTGEWGPPYFNAGMLVANPSIDLSTHWIETCIAIRDCDKIKNKYPWLDQVALPVTILRRKITYQLLSHLFNYPLHTLPLPSYKQPCIIHYHWPEVIAKYPSVLKLVLELIKEYHLEEILSCNNAWSILAKSPETCIKKRPTSLSAQKVKKEFFITGIPRSGTSLLCSLLDALPNVAVLNEPAEIFRDFRIPQFDALFAKTVENWRTRILEGKPVNNKMAEGKVSANTFSEDGTDPFGMKYTPYTTSVEDADFALGIKNPLVFLTRLKHIRKNYPNALIINMVRHPYYTVGSWIRTFDHLREVWLHGSLLHGFNSPVIGNIKKFRLMQLYKINDLAMRRAGFWEYLASLDLPADDPLYIRLKYEDLINDPEYWIRKIYRILFPDKKEPSTITSRLYSRNKSSNYHISDWQKKCIQNICINHMDSLGYDI